MQQRHRFAAWLALCLAALVGTPAPAQASVVFPCSFVSDAAGALRPLGLAMGRTSPANAAPGTIVLSPAYLPYVNVGVPYSEIVSASGGSAPYTFALTAGSLPAGLVLAPNGTLAGTVAYDSYYDYEITITATDATGATGSRDYTMEVGVVGTIVVSPPSIPDGTVDESYSVLFTASGGTPPYDFQCVGALPPGLMMDSDGQLSGTPTEAGMYDFTIFAQDATSTVGSRDYVLLVEEDAIELTPTSLPDGSVGAGYSADADASGGQSPYYYYIQDGELPPGLDLHDGTGAITGTPTTPGDFGFTLAVLDAFESQATRDYLISIEPATILLDPGTLADATVGTAYEQPLSASGGTEPYSFAVTAGSLPAGMGMDGDGIIDGTPEEAGTFEFAVAATDAFDQTGEHAYTLVVQAPVIGITPTAVPDATVGVAYEVVFSASGGNAPYTFAVTGGSLPSGLLLDSDGTFHGEPTTTGDYGFTVTATDNFGQTGEQAYTLTVQNATITIAPDSLPPGSVGTAYEKPLGASGGTDPYSYAVTSGSLPPGMGMDGDGIIDGTPEASGEFGFAVTATDAFGQTGEQAYTLSILAPTIVLEPDSLPDGNVGENYAQAVSASGGNAPYTFAVTSGALPAGLLLDSDGSLHGTPTQAGTFPLTITATDNFDQTGTQSYVLTIVAGTITVNPPTLPAGTVGNAYQQVLTANGGSAPHAFAITSGSLPPGLALDPGGAMEGVPEQAGTFAFTVTATDVHGQAGKRSYALVVEAATILLAPGTLPDAAVDAPYTQDFSASGGTAPYTFTIGEGTLPEGLALGPEGTLAGTPLAGGSFAFSVVATDAFEQAGSADYLLVVSAPALPDPTDDPDVIGLLVSQVSTVRTFATTQVRNVHERLEELHDGSGEGWGFWIAGSLRSGDRDGTDTASPLDFETSGVTGGSDYRLSGNFAFGGGLGYARDRTAIGTEGSRADGDAPSGVSYMSWHPEDMPFFLDGMGG